jgi:hypothetical protein
MNQPGEPLCPKSLGIKDIKLLLYNTGTCPILACILPPTFVNLTKSTSDLEGAEVNVALCTECYSIWLILTTPTQEFQELLLAQIVQQQAWTDSPLNEAQS